MSRYSSTDATSQAGDWLAGAARRNPEALLLLAAGCCLLMRSRGSSFSRLPSRSRYGEFEQGQSGSNRVSSDAGRVTSNLRGGLSRATESAGDYASDIGERVSDTAGAYAESISEFAQDARRYAVIAAVLKWLVLLRLRPEWFSDGCSRESHARCAAPSPPAPSPLSCRPHCVRYPTTGTSLHPRGRPHHRRATAWLAEGARQEASRRGLFLYHHHSVGRDRRPHRLPQDRSHPVAVLVPPSSTECLRLSFWSASCSAPATRAS